MVEVDEKKPRVALEEYIREAKKVKARLEKYSKDELVDKLNGYVKKAEQLKATLISPDDPSSKSPPRSTVARLMAFTALPKGIRAAVQDFASQCDITTVMDHLEDLLHREVDRDDDSENVVPDDEVNISDWETGVENLEHKTFDDLWNDYGLGNVKAVPGFNTREDPSGKIDPWSPEGVRYLADPNSSAVPFGPQWHQLLGATGMLLRKFRGRGTLLMDEVGVGKTMQVIVLQMFLIYLRSYQEAHDTYPPLFSK